MSATVMPAAPAIAPERSAGLPRLRPYQAEIARAILALVAGDRRGSISVEVARQGGKNEVSAQVELALLLGRSRAGGEMVKAAPTLAPQARISLERLRSRARLAGVEPALEVRGATVRCGAARIHFLSASPHANVVGHTASLLLEVDEAQAVEPERFDRDFRPMAASTGAPVVFYGTPWGPRSLLEQAKAEHREAERRDGRRRCFRFDWRAVAAHNPAYARYVERERDRLGERHPLFRTQYELEVVDDAGRLFDGATLAQVEGTHERLRAPRPGERYVAGLDLAGPAHPATVGSEHDGASRDLDSTVLTIARVEPDAARSAAPHIEVVEHQAWQGEATEPLLEALADRLRRVWRVRHLAVDATGLGGPLASLLAARLGERVVEPVVFTVERKSRLGFGLLAAALSGRLRLYGGDGSAEWAECRRQLALARAVYRDDRTMQFDVDPAEGHDDYLMSLALAVAAARHAGAPRLAHGRSAHESAGVERERGGAA